MRQFDICRRKNPGQGKSVQFVVILQSDVLQDLTTRLAAPMVPIERLPQVTRSMPVVDHSGRRYAIVVEHTSVLARSTLGVVVGSAANQEYRIKKAIDLVFFGV